MTNEIEKWEKVIYVAGPYRADTPWKVEQNVRRAEEAALYIWLSGAIALCPHTMTRNYDKTGTDEMWIKGTKELLRRCDGVFLIYGWENSEGTMGELELADERGIPVFDNVILDSSGEDDGVTLNNTLALQRLHQWLSYPGSYDIEASKRRRHWWVRVMVDNLLRLREGLEKGEFPSGEVEGSISGVPDHVRARWKRIQEWQSSGEMMQAFEQWEEAIEKGGPDPPPIRDYIADTDEHEAVPFDVDGAVVKAEMKLKPMKPKSKLDLSMSGSKYTGE